MAEDARTASLVLFDRVVDQAERLKSALEDGIKFMEGYRARWEAGERVIHIFEEMQSPAFRRAVQDAVDDFEEAMALTRGLVLLAAIEEGATYSELERVTNLRRQTLADLVNKARDQVPEL